MGSDQNCFASSSSSLCSETQPVNCSKAQNCLLKILKIISTVPPRNDTLPSQKLNGFAIDLNIGLNSPPPETEEESGSPVDGGFIKSPVVAECGGVDFRKCSDIDGEEKSCESDTCVEILQLESNGVSETSEIKEEIVEVKEQQGYMGLLIEAATLIFGDFKDENPKSEWESETKSFKLDNTRGKLKMDEQHYHDDDHHHVAITKKQLKRRNKDDYTEEVIEDKSSYPLVRSKRGRIQVLPNKYRDSILDPLTPFSRIRSTIVPNRRRSK